jgi:hypothetical protein
MQRQISVQLVFQSLEKEGRSPQVGGLKESTVKQGFYSIVESIYRGGVGHREQ